MLARYTAIALTFVTCHSIHISLWALAYGWFGSDTPWSDAFWTVGTIQVIGLVALYIQHRQNRMLNRIAIEAFLAALRNTPPTAVRFTEDGK